jgi:hypothetical protein
MTTDTQALSAHAINRYRERIDAAASYDAIVRHIFTPAVVRAVEMTARDGGVVTVNGNRIAVVVNSGVVVSIGPGTSKARWRRYGGWRPASDMAARSRRPGNWKNQLRREGLL